MPSFRFFASLSLSLSRSGDRWSGDCDLEAIVVCKGWGLGSLLEFSVVFLRFFWGFLSFFLGEMMIRV